mgnify:FL=1
MVKCHAFVHPLCPQLWYISGGLLSLHVAHKSWGKKPSYLVDFKGAKAIVHGKYAL